MCVYAHMHMYNLLRDFSWEKCILSGNIFQNLVQKQFFNPSRNSETWPNTPQLRISGNRSMFLIHYNHIHVLERFLQMLRGVWSAEGIRQREERQVTWQQQLSRQEEMRA